MYKVHSHGLLVKSTVRFPIQLPKGVMASVLSVAIAAVSSVSCVNAASFTVDTLASFNAAIEFGPTKTDTFDGTTANSPVIDFGDFRSTISDPDEMTIHRKLNDRFLFQLEGEGEPVDTFATIVFDNPIFGIGFDNLGLDAIDISVDGGVTFFDIYTVSPSPDGFFGIISDTPFDTVLFDILGSPNGEGGLIDNLVYTTGTVSTVPLPSSGLLLLAGLFGGGLSRRIKRT